MRLALIGAGRWGRRYISTLEKNPACELACLVSSNPKNEALISPACELIADWRKINEIQGIDGVIIATPPQFHAAMAKTLLDQGFPVLIEKPLTMDLSEALDVLETARQSGKSVFVNHIHLYGPAYRELKEQLKSAGPIRHIECCAGNSGPYRREIFPLWDWGVHDVAMCLDLTSEYPAKCIPIRNTVQYFDEGIGEDAELWLEFPSGVTAHIHVSNLFTEKKRVLSVHCTDKVLVYDDQRKEKLIVHRLNKFPEFPTILDQLPLDVIITEFCQAIMQPEAMIGGLILGLDCVKLLENVQNDLRG